MVNTVREGVMQVNNKNRVFICTKNRATYYSYILAKKPLHFSKENLYWDYFGIVIPKQSLLKEPFDIA